MNYLLGPCGRDGAVKRGGTCERKSPRFGSLKYQVHLSAPCPLSSYVSTAVHIVPNTTTTYTRAAYGCLSTARAASHYATQTRLPVSPFILASHSVCFVHCIVYCFAGRHLNIYCRTHHLPHRRPRYFARRRFACHLTCVDAPFSSCSTT